jgi:uncharacterized protein YhjY with autotransporter beta-barrel domain
LRAAGVALGVGLAGLAAAQTPPTVQPINQSVDEGQSVSAFSVSGAFNPGSCFLAAPGPVVTVNGGTSAALDGGTISAGAVGANVSYASNTGLAFGTSVVTLAFNYQCSVGGPVQTINDPNGLTLTIPQFAPGTTSIVVPENSGARTISAAMLAPGRNYDSVTITSPPTHGTAVAASGANGSITYTPTANSFGTDTLQYVLTQAGAVTGTAYRSVAGTIAVTITQALPIATADTYTVPPNTATPLNVTSNDLDGPFTALAIATAPTHGTATVNPATLAVTYTPTNGYSGADSFTYTVTNAVGRSAPAAVTIQVSQAPPVANPDSATVPPNVATVLNVTANDTGSPFTALAIATVPAHGTTTVNPATLAVTYTPTAGYSGADRFTYTVSNAAGTSAPAAVTIQVSQAAPVANPDSETVPPNVATVLNVTANDTGSPFTALAIVTGPSHGTATVNPATLAVTYTPTSAYSGADQFTYTVSNAAGTSAPAAVSITVGQSVPTSPPINVTTTAGHAVTFNATAQATGQPITALSIASAPKRGTATGALPNITYTPGAAFTSGSDSFTFVLTNSAGQSAPITATIQIAGSGPVPVAQPIAVSTPPGTPITVAVANSASGGPFTGVTIVQPPPRADGTVRVQGLSIVFTPASTFAGTAVLTYTISNATGTSAPATLQIVVGSRPAPLASPQNAPNVSAVLNNQIDITRRFYEVQIRNFTRHLEDMHHGGHGFSLSLGGLGLPSGAPAPADPPAAPPASSSDTGASTQADAASPYGGPTLSADTDDAAAPAADPSAAAASASTATPPPAGPAGTPIELPDRVGGFATPIGNIGSQSPEYKHNGFDYATVGLSAGGDYRLNDWIIVGIGGGYTHDEDEIGSDGTRDTARSFNVTAYGTIQATDQIYIDSIVTWASLNFDTRRFVPSNGLYAYSNRDGDQLYGAVTGGYEFDDGPLTLAPYVRLNLATTVLDRFAESGAGTASLTVGNESLTDFSSVIGFRGDYAISLEDSVLSPHFRLEYLHEFLGGTHASADYVDQPLGLTSQFIGDPVDRNNFTLGIGFSWLTENALSITVDYEAQLGVRNEDGHSFTFGITRRF